MIQLIADSSSDRPKLSGVKYVPLIISTDEKSFVDNEHLNVNELLDYLASHKGRSYTACPSVDRKDGIWAATGINEANVGMTAT